MKRTFVKGPEIKPGPSAFKDKFYISGEIPDEGRPGNNRTLYLHRDGQWLGSTKSGTGYTGYFDSRSAAEQALAAAS